MRAIDGIEKLELALKGRRTVVLFHATWCPYCRAFKPVFEELAPRAAGYEALEVVLDDDDNPLWEKCDIDAVPTVIVFDDGKVARRADARRGVGLAAADLERVLAGAAARKKTKKKPRKK